MHLLWILPLVAGLAARKWPKLEPRWTPENRPVVDGGKPASGRAAPSTSVVPRSIVIGVVLQFDPQDHARLKQAFIDRYGPPMEERPSRSAWWGQTVVIFL